MTKEPPIFAPWVPTALAMGSWFLLWGDCGLRTQEQAAIPGQARELPIFLTDGWKAYMAVLLQVIGVIWTSPETPSSFELSCGQTEEVEISPQTARTLRLARPTQPFCEAVTFI